MRVEAKYRKYTRLNYKIGGRSPEEGVDCYGLVKLILEQEHGVKNLINYGPGLSPEDDQDIIKATFEEAVASKNWKKLEEPEIGSVVWAHLVGEYHVGIVVGDGMMLHVLDETGVVLEDFRGLRWQHRILGFYKWIG